MGSAASLAIPRECLGGADPEAVRAARAWLDLVEVTLSPYREDSDLCRWWAGRIDAAESQMLAAVLRDCRELTRLTDGGFQPMDPHGRYDPTGYVKGWAVRRAVDTLAEWGVERAALGVGGDVQTIGWAAGGRPWRVAVADPAEASRIVAIVAARSDAPLAVATSGNAQRGEHVWSMHRATAPLGQTGSARQGLGQTGPARPASVTVIGAELGTADAFATAIWSASRARSLPEAWAFLAGTGYDALVIDAGGRVHSTDPARLVGSAPAC
jgi:thiamine biosynthesis lipoprotein